MSASAEAFKGVKLFISDKWVGVVEALAEFYPDVLWQRCVLPFYRTVFSFSVPTAKVTEGAAMRKAIHAQKDRKAA